MAIFAPEVDPAKISALAAEMDPTPFIQAINQMPAAGPMMPAAQPQADFNSVVNGPKAQAGMPPGGMGNLAGFVNMMQPKPTNAVAAAGVPRGGQMQLPSMPQLKGPPDLATILGRRYG